MVASEAHGIDESLFVEWMRKGQVNASGHGVYHKFYEAIKQAEAELEAGLVGIITQASIKDWKAAAWLAERRFPERYVRKSVGDAAPKPGAGEADPFDKVDKVVPIRAVN
jgi:hypothetical protein